MDGLQAAIELQRSSPADFWTLATTPVNFHYINDGHHLHCSHPTFDLPRPLDGASNKKDADDQQFTLSLKSINYSPPFQAPLPVDTPVEFFSALAKYDELLNSTGNTFTHLLQEGEAVIFDNRRVLHGRTAFKSKETGDGSEGETDRWLKGCYLEEDPILDKVRILALQSERVT